MDPRTIICTCKKVTYGAIEDAVHGLSNLTDVLKLFDEVQKQTNCSTGCGRCHDRILDIIADLIYQK